MQYNFKKKHLIYFDNKRSILPEPKQGYFFVYFKESGTLYQSQLKAILFFIKKRLKFFSRLFIRSFCFLRKTKKPVGVRMGKGKGTADIVYASIKKGQIFFEFGFGNSNSQNLTEKELKTIELIVNLVNTKSPIKLQLSKKL